MQACFRLTSATSHAAAQPADQMDRHDGPPEKTGWRSRLFAKWQKPPDGARQQMQAAKSLLFAQLPLNASILDVGIGGGPNLNYYVLRVRARTQQRHR